jgi:hypothetical protein
MVRYNFSFLNNTTSDKQQRNSIDLRMKMSEYTIKQRTTSFEHLSAEIILSIFDYLTPIEILVTCFHSNQRLRSMIYYYLQSGYRLTQFNFHHVDHLLYKRFCHDILPYFQSMITSLQLGSSYHYGQVEEFQHYELPCLDALTIHLIDDKQINHLLDRCLTYNRLQWFDKIHLIMNDDVQGWNERLPFCVQNIPVRQLIITGTLNIDKQTSNMSIDRNDRLSIEKETTTF